MKILNFKFKNSNKPMSFFSAGFSLVELMISITIIGILSVIVITSLNTSRTKAYDARVKEQLSRFRSSAEVYYTNQEPNGYTPTTANCVTPSTLFTNTSGVDGSPGIFLNFTGINPPVTVVCGADANGYALKATLVSGGGWCVDSKGTSKVITDLEVPGSATVCP